MEAEVEVLLFIFYHISIIIFQLSLLIIMMNLVVKTEEIGIEDCSFSLGSIRLPSSPRVILSNYSGQSHNHSASFSICYLFFVWFVVKKMLAMKEGSMLCHYTFVIMFFPPTAADDIADHLFLFLLLLLMLFYAAVIPQIVL